MGGDYLKLVASNGRMSGHSESAHMPGQPGDPE